MMRKDLLVRGDGRVEWLCEHGVGHTIALPGKAVREIIQRDEFDGRKASVDAWFSHGCDGCCSK